MKNVKKMGVGGGPHSLSELPHFKNGSGGENFLPNLGEQMMKKDSGRTLVKTGGQMAKMGEFGRTNC